MTTNSLTMTEVDETVPGADEITPPVLTPDEIETPITRQVIPNDEARTLRRALQRLIDRKVGPILVCITCQEAQRPEIIQWAKDDASGNLVMVCGCTVRILDGITR